MKSDKPVRFGWKKTLIYSLLPAVFLFAFLEGAAHVHEWRVPPLKPYYDLGFRPDYRLFGASKEEPGTMCILSDQLPMQRFAMSKPSGTVRIFVVGGSSVNHLCQDLPPMAERLTQASGGQHRFEAIDCGLPAYGSSRLNMIVKEVLDYEPDLIIFYECNNEFEEVEQFDLVNLRTVPLQKLLYKSALCRYIRDRSARATMARIQRALSRDRIDYLPAQIHNFTPEEIAERMVVFRKNLTSIIRSCQERGVPLILGTVPSNLYRPDLSNRDMLSQVIDLYNAGQYQKGAMIARQVLAASSRHQASSVENGIVRSLASAYGIPIADVEAAVTAAEPHHVPGETLFNDRCHLNAEGNRILIAVFEKSITDFLKAKRHGRLSFHTPPAP